MKSIKITNQNKINFSNRTVGSWYIGQIPKVFIVGNEQIFGYDSREDLHDLHGWKDFVQEPIGENQKRTNEIIESENSVAYEVVDMTEAEIVQQLKSTAQSEREQKIQEELKQIIVNDAQALTDDEALNNSVVYPFWEVGIEVFVNQKYQFFVGRTLQLFKVVQDHTTQSDWTPPQVPALFTRIAAQGVILPWKQPIGAQDAYNIGDKVRFNNKVYESTINANVWSPTAYPQGWTLIN